jgi:hypothetical protein
VVHLSPGERRSLDVRTVCLDAGRAIPRDEVFEAAPVPLPAVRVAALRRWAERPEIGQGTVNVAIWQNRELVHPGSPRTPRSAPPVVRRPAVATPGQGPTPVGATGGGPRGRGLPAPERGADGHRSRRSGTLPGDRHLSGVSHLAGALRGRLRTDRCAGALGARDDRWSALAARLSIPIPDARARRGRPPRARRRLAVRPRVPRARSVAHHVGGALPDVNYSCAPTTIRSVQQSGGLKGGGRPPWTEGPKAPESPPAGGARLRPTLRSICAHAAPFSSLPRSFAASSR